MQQRRNQVLMEAPAIRAALEGLADRIVADARSRGALALIGIHTGGVYLARRLRDLVRERHGLAVPVGTLDIALYRDDWTRIGPQPVVRATDLPFSVDDREVILVDDVLYTGRTIRAALDALMDYGRPRRVRVAVLVDRGHRELPICAEYVGASIETDERDQVNVHLVERGGLDQVVVEHDMAA